MCGICGIINFDNSPVERIQIAQMMQAMKHRGPDDEGVYVKDNVGLGFVRLSILDLSISGHQPMLDDSGKFLILFNGEVYNFIEIRDILKNKGYQFRSNTDTEVVLKSYLEWGEDCLNHFNGMWAFVIHNIEDKELFFARDRFGIKPFYYFKDDKQFIFSSEITPILQTNPQLRTVNDSIVFDYLLTNRTNHTENTFFRSIKKLQHSSKINIKINKGIINIGRWYSLNNSNNSGYTNSENFKEDLVSAINMQLRSDVPIGLCLSGGLDSSSIGATVSKIIGRKDIHSFSAVYGLGQKGDESEFIREFSGYIDNIHFTYPTIGSFTNNMDAFVNCLEEPVPGTSEYAEFKVMELAKDYCTVILNGQGVDEYLAGYHYFIGFLLKQRAMELKFINILQEVYKYYKIHGSVYPIQAGIFFMLPPWLKKFLLFKKNDYLSSQFFNEYSKQKQDFSLDILYSSKTLKESFLNHFEYKFEHHLLWADKSGMAFSLETRFPFLDHNIVEKMLNTDTSLVYINGITKIILRQAMKGIIPEKVRNRMDKVGYETPEDEWFRSEIFQKYFLEIINSEQFKNRPYFDSDEVYRLNAQHILGKKNNGKEIWKILHLELWIRKFID
jgi:asparagine synthase (glutamine-hydrolysing)